MDSPEETPYGAKLNDSFSVSGHNPRPRAPRSTRPAMPDPEFQVTGVETDAQGMVPLMRFRLRISNALPSAAVHSILLHTQIQIEPAQRTYNQAEQEKLIELFGTPDRWGQTLRNRLWAHADTTIGAFTTEIEAALTVPCTYDLNIASATYFHALDNGEVSLLF